MLINILWKVKEEREGRMISVCKRGGGIQKVDDDWTRGLFNISEWMEFYLGIRVINSEQNIMQLYLLYKFYAVNFSTSGQALPFEACECDSTPSHTWNGLEHTWISWEVLFAAQQTFLKDKACLRFGKHHCQSNILLFLIFYHSGFDTVEGKKEQYKPPFLEYYDRQMEAKQGKGSGGAAQPQSPAPGQQAGQSGDLPQSEGSAQTPKDVPSLERPFYENSEKVSTKLFVRILFLWLAYSNVMCTMQAYHTLANHCLQPQIYKGDPRTCAIFIPAWGSN